MTKTRVHLSLTILEARALVDAALQMQDDFDEWARSMELPELAPAYRRGMVKLQNALRVACQRTEGA